MIPRHPTISLSCMILACACAAVMAQEAEPGSGFPSFPSEEPGAAGPIIPAQAPEDPAASYVKPMKKGSAARARAARKGKGVRRARKGPIKPKAGTARSDAAAAGREKRAPAPPALKDPRYPGVPLTPMTPRNP